MSKNPKLVDYKNFSEYDPSFGDLPMEIIIHIFRYLNFSDLQNAALTCSYWNEASQYFEFQKKKMVKISKKCISDKLSPVTVFTKSHRDLQNIYLDETFFGTIDTFFTKIGKTLKSITFDCVDLTEKQFCSILKELTNLKELTITNCSPLFMAGQFLEQSADRGLIADAIVNVSILSLRNNQYLSDAILLRLLSLIAEIKTLDMSECHIAYHSAIQRRFYPEELANTPSESILTFKFLLELITLHAKSLKSLSLSKTLIGSNALIALAAVPNLKLEEVYFSRCDQLNSSGICSFVEKQRLIRVLDLSKCRFLTDTCIECISEHLAALTELRVNGCLKLTNRSAVLISQMSQLKSVNMSQCSEFTSDGLMEGYGGCRVNTSLRELYIRNLNVSEESLLKCIRNLPELRVFDISNCTNGVTDVVVQAVISNMKYLRKLSLENCTLITDGAFTGLVSTQPAKANSQFVDQGSMKISLRSRAEEEIVRDAERKRAMIALHEANILENRIDDKSITIEYIKGLQSLNLKGCSRITDVSLKYGFKFLELRQLILSSCQQITLVGIDSLVKNCPSIEELDICDCYSINDKAFELITRHLKRLRVLNISGCILLTEHSLDSILVNCKYLQTITVYRSICSTDIESRLSSLSSLRTIYMDRLGAIDPAEMLRIPNRVDY